MGESFYRSSTVLLYAGTITVGRQPLHTAAVIMVIPEACQKASNRLLLAFSSSDYRSLLREVAWLNM